MHVAEILQICCDSHRAAPELAVSAEEHVWETCELVPAGLAEISPECGFAAYLQEPRERNHISLPSAVEGERILLLQVNPNADSSSCTFNFPGCCG